MLCQNPAGCPPILTDLTRSRFRYHTPINVVPTTPAPQIFCNCVGLKSLLVQFLAPKSTTGTFPAELPFLNIKNRNPTSVVVIRILMMMSTMTIMVIVLIFISAKLSLRISARSRKTLQRSLRTLMRGVISRYSRMAK